MEATSYLIEIKYNGAELKVKGSFDGTTFKSETIEPMHEGGTIVITSFKELDEYITAKKFKK